MPKQDTVKKPPGRNYAMLVLAIVVAMVILAPYRSARLDRVIYAQGLSQGDISRIKVDYAVWVKDRDSTTEILPVVDITEDAYVAEIMSLLSGKSIRKRLNQRMTEHYPTDFQRPTLNMTIVFQEGKSLTQIFIGAHPYLTVNGVRYTILSPEGIDTRRIWDIAGEP